jgi:hypothetical protein
VNARAEATLIGVEPFSTLTGIDFLLYPGGRITGVMRDKDTMGVPQDSTCGIITLNVGWHRFVYRQEEMEGGQLSRAGFKAPGDASWRLFSTDECDIRTQPSGSTNGLTLITKKNVWTDHPGSHAALMICVDADATCTAGWCGTSVVDRVDHGYNLHGNSDDYVSYYDAYFHVATGGVWQFSTDSDDASEIVIDDIVVAKWYGGHGPAERWEFKADVRLNRVVGNSREFVDSTRGNSDGSYQFDNLPPGDYLVEAVVPGYVAQHFSNAPSWDVASPVRVYPGETTTNISFYLQRPSYIAGRVTDKVNGLPIGGLGVRVERVQDPAHPGDDWRFVDGSLTDANGCYEVPVPPGSNYVVEVEAGNTFYCRLTWNNVQNRDDATLLSVGRASTVSNIDFAVSLGGRITGYVYQPDGVTPLERCSVFASFYEQGAWVDGVDTDSSGYYSMTVPTGSTYRIRMRPANSNLPYLDQYYSNTMEWGSAVAVAVAPTHVTSNINFTARSPSYITGRIADGRNGQPLAGIRVQPCQIPDPSNYWDNWIWFDSVDTDTNGDYTLMVPPGSNFLVEAQAGDSYYYSRCWSNVNARAEATLIGVEPFSTLTGIDFLLYPGGRITGRIYRSDGRTPLADCNVGAEDYISGRWMGGGRTDNTGYYSITVPGGASYRVRASPSDDGCPYLNAYYSNTVNWVGAMPVPVAAFNDTTGIDFVLSTPAYVYGRVLCGGVPVAGENVNGAMIPNTNDFWNNWTWFNSVQTDTNGYYALPVSPESNIIIRFAGSESFYLFQCWSNVWDQRAAALLTIPQGGAVSNINFDVVMGCRVAGRVVDENGQPFGGGRGSVSVNTLDVQGAWAWVSGWGTDNDGRFDFAVPAGTNYFLTVEDSHRAWCPRMFYNNQLFIERATFFNGGVGSVVSNLNFQMIPGFKVQGRLYHSDGVTPMGGQVSVVNASEVVLGVVHSDSGGWYEQWLPTNAPFYLRCGGGGTVDAYYNREYNFARATPLQLPSQVTTNIDFVQYDESEDADRDHVPDWIEALVLGTSVSNPDDRFVCLGCARASSNKVTLTWASKPGKDYYVSRSTNVMATSGWTTVAGPIRAVSTVTSITDTNTAMRSFYRIGVRY